MSETNLDSHEHTTHKDSCPWHLRVFRSFPLHVSIHVCADPANFTTNFIHTSSPSQLLDIPRSGLSTFSHSLVEDLTALLM